VALAAGAYNAGSRPMMRWCDRNGKRPLDEFVELVTYEQSRLYMKLVLEIYARYRYLYEGRPWEPALPVAGCQYEPGGPAD
jgi:soluble lytic murein transglycosylase